MAKGLMLGNIIGGAWQSFREMCIHKDAPAVQVEEMRKAFYGGATSILSTMLAVGESDISDVNAMRIMTSLHEEVQAFAKALPDNGAGGLTDQQIILKH
jgi:hypothetical protein